MFSCVWLYFKKCFEKYFLVFGCVLENTIENTFSTCCSHFLTFSPLPNKYIISFIPQYRNTNKTQKKKIIKSSQIKRRMKREKWLGLTRGKIVRQRWSRDRAAMCCDRDWRGTSWDCDRCEGEIAIDGVISPLRLWVVLSLSLSPFARLWAPLFARLSSRSDLKVK